MGEDFSSWAPGLFGSVAKIWTLLTRQATGDFPFWRGCGTCRPEKSGVNGSFDAPCLVLFNEGLTPLIIFWNLHPHLPFT